MTPDHIAGISCAVDHQRRRKSTTDNAEIALLSSTYGTEENSYIDFTKFLQLHSSYVVN